MNVKIKAISANEVIELERFHKIKILETKNITKEEAMEDLAYAAIMYNRTLQHIEDENTKTEMKSIFEEVFSSAMKIINTKKFKVMATILDGMDDAYIIRFEISKNKRILDIKEVMAKKVYI